MKLKLLQLLGSVLALGLLFAAVSLLRGDLVGVVVGIMLFVVGVTTARGAQVLRWLLRP